MLYENMSRPARKDFNHRPLKKRPFQVDEVEVVETPPVSPSYEDNSEPENLSTKPEDLLRTGNYPRSAASPQAAEAPLPLRRWPTPELSPQCIPHHYPPYPPHSPPQYVNRLVAPTPTYLTAYPSRPLELLHAEQPWARSPPVYATCLPFPYEPYNSLSPRAACSPPVKMESTPHSPSSMVSSDSLSPQFARPKELSSPLSVDSGISTESIPRRRRDPSAQRYQCTDCGKSYSTYSGLTKHRQFHCAAAEGNLAKKSFSCKYCTKVYNSLGALKMHIRTHTLPCKCHLCGKAFSRPWLLQGHIRTHTGEKPFSCHHCRRAFADRSNLRAHLQTHSEVKKYSCASCSKTFSRMSLLSKHLEGGCPGFGTGMGSPPYEYRSEEMAY